MSMTKEEAIKILKHLAEIVSSEDYQETFKMAASALRPVSRERVEKVWRGCEYCKKHKINLVRIEMDYNDSPGSPERLNPTRIPKFCPICGAPMTDEAVDMMLKRMEEIYK